MKWLFILLFILGCLFSNAGRGAEERRQKRTYWTVAGIIWLALLVLANALL